MPTRLSLFRSALASATSELTRLVIPARRAAIGAFRRLKQNAPFRSDIRRKDIVKE
jgi:hypothetical protein